MRGRTQITTLFALAFIFPALGVLAALYLSVNTPLLLSFLVGIILVYLSFVVYFLESQLRPIRDFLSSQPHITTVREQEFYKRFNASVEGARRRVDICYFDNKSPFEGADRVKREYYEDIEKTIKRKSGVEFRRIVRALPKTEEWLEQMVNNLSGISNFALACILDEEPASASLPHVSVQVIDSDITFLVAVGEQRETDVPRDLFIKSREMNRLWSRYFLRLWTESFVVIDRGVVDDESLRKVREHISRSQGHEF